MRKALLLSISFFSFMLVKAQPISNILQSALTDTIIPKLQEQVDCNEQKMVLPKTFTKLTGTVLTKLAPNVTGELKQGSNATLKFSDDKTTAEVGLSFNIKDRFILNFGLNGAVNNNITGIYSGTSGLAADWGTRLGVSIPIWKSVFYKSKEVCDELHMKRDRYMAALYDSIAPYVNPEKLRLRNRVDSLRRALRNSRIQSNARNNFRTADATATELTEAIKILQLRDAIYEDEYENYKEIHDDLKDFFRDSVVAFETRAAKLTGYSITLLNFGGSYNRKSFMQFFPNVPLYNKRFKDTVYNNWTFNIGVSHFRSGPKVSSNVGIDVSYIQRSNFEQPGSKKYQFTYVNDSLLSPGAPNVTQKRTETKKAYDSSLIQFKTFHAFDVNLQGTWFFGEAKTIGLNTVGRLSFSSFYTNTLFDILVGPVISVANADKEGSKLNFALMAGYQDIFNDETEMAKKFSLSFFVSVPFKVFLK